MCVSRDHDKSYLSIDRPAMTIGGSFIFKTVAKEILNGQELDWIERSNRPIVQSDIFFS